MKPRLSVLVNLGLVLAVALSGLVIQAPAVSSTAEFHAAPAAANPPLAARANPGRHRTHQRERGRERSRQDKHRQRQQPDASDPDSWPDKGPTVGSPAGNDGDDQGGDEAKNGKWRDYCTAPDSEKLPEIQQCTHGPDPAPPGFRVDRAVRAVSVQAAEVGTPEIVCQSDGTSGSRIQVLYVHGANVTSRYDQLLGSFRSWAEQADQIFQTSAADTGGTRNLRFVHDISTPCQITVLDVTVPSSAVNNFDAMNANLQSQGFDRTDRVYLEFVDTTSAGICGIGTIWIDDSPSAANWNNVGPSYARVDAGCWSGHVAAHELMHNLGGVQLSAPNTSGGFHCIDEYDVMCYSDTPNQPRMRYDCLNPTLDTTRFDCGHQDYYNTNPASGSYLATHWNVANNQFLIAGGSTTPPPPPPPPPPPDTTAPAVQWTAPVGNTQTAPVTTGTVALQVTATDDTGVARVEFWRYDNAVDDWVPMDTDTSAPYESSIDAGSLGIGTTYLSADAYDAAGNWSYKQIALDRSLTVSPPPPDNPTPTPPPDQKKHKKHNKHKHKKRH